MKNVLKVWGVVLLLALLCCPSSFGVEFRLKNGDSVSGEIISYDGATFQVKSKFGVLSIEANDLAVIAMNTEEGVVDIILGSPAKDNRDRVRGEIEYVREGEVKIKTDYGYVMVNSLDKATGIFLSESEVGKTTTATTHPVAAQQVIETQGISFTLQDCNRSGDSVTCHFLIVSDQDKKLKFRSYALSVFAFIEGVFQAESLKMLITSSVSAICS